ncbi:hypothetical protein SDSG_00040 [Ruegeria phage DSS3-P1]|nr:hypothetical protein SDSG_00040 [Ruegeria phage DSS3-P1]
MPDSFRLTTLKALTSALEEITIANGYQHDLADRVHRGRVTLTQEDEIPLVTILEKPVFPEQLPTPAAAPRVKLSWNCSFRALRTMTAATPLIRRIFSWRTYRSVSRSRSCARTDSTSSALASGSCRSTLVRVSFARQTRLFQTPRSSGSLSR